MTHCQMSRDAWDTREQWSVTDDTFGLGAFVTLDAASHQEFAKKDALNTMVYNAFRNS